MRQILAVGAAVCGFYAAAAVSAASVEDEPSPKHIGTVYDRPAHRSVTIPKLRMN